MTGEWMKLPKAVASRSDLTSTAKVVYAVLKDRESVDGVAWPGIRCLARDAGVRVATVHNAVHALQKAGLLTIESRGRGRSHVYKCYENRNALGVTKTVTPVTETVTPECYENRNTGVTETVTEALRKPEHNQTDPLNLTTNGARHTGKPRKLNPIWDAVCEVFGLKPVTKADRTRVGKITRDLKAKGATPAEIKRRLERYRHAWPKAADTPEALLKHWDRFSGDETHDHRTDRGARLAASPDKYAHLE